MTTKDQRDELKALRTRLKSGEYDGADIMKAWIAIDTLLDSQQPASVDASVEPVAWYMSGDPDGEQTSFTTSDGILASSYSQLGWKQQPLYLHPAAEQVPVAYPDNELVAVWWAEGHIAKESNYVPNVIARKAIDWYRSSTAKEVPADDYAAHYERKWHAVSAECADLQDQLNAANTKIVQMELASRQSPADVLAALDELEKIAIRSCSNECTINFEYMNMPECTCGTRNRNAMLEDRFAKLRSLLGGEA